MPLPVSEAASVAVAQNEAPADITVAGGSVQENAAAGTVVATLAAIDPNAGDTFSYALTSDPSGSFEVVGNEVRVKAGANIDYETATSHDITVTVTDAGGLSYSEVISIAVTNQSGTIVGTSGNDVLIGTAEEDVISGLGGDDTLYGGAGNDTLIGGDGNDTYIIDAPGDTVTELAGEGTDTVAEQHQLHAGRQRREPDADGTGQHQRHRQHAGQHADRQRRQQHPERRRRQRHADRGRRSGNDTYVVDRRATW